MSAMILPLDPRLLRDLSDRALDSAIRAGVEAHRRLLAEPAATVAEFTDLQAWLLQIETEITRRRAERRRFALAWIGRPQEGGDDA